MEVRGPGSLVSTDANHCILAPTRPTVKAIIFFGAPHRGLEVTAIQSMVQGTPSEDLVRELKMHSPTLTRLNDGFRRVYGDIKILTIYEMEPTASLRKNDFDIWERSGPPVMMVEKDSATLYWSMETRIGLNHDHSRIAKLDRGQNGCYDDVCHFLQQSLSSTHKANIVPILNARPLHSSALPSSSEGSFLISRKLCKAIEIGDSEAARDLVQSVEKGSLAKLRRNLLCLAIQHCPEILSTLLDAGADISARNDEEGYQAIHIAGRYAKNHDIVELLLDAGADVNARDDRGWMPLHFVANFNENPEIVQVLIDAGATVNVTTDGERTPLHCAAQENPKPEMCHVLIDAGATVNAPDTLGRTPLHCATERNNNPEILQVLIDAGATVNAPDTRGNTPLHCAADWNNNPEILQVLIDAGARINARNTKQITPLHNAAQFNKTTGVLGALIKANADVNATTDVGASPLMLSASHDNLEACRELLTAGAHPNQKGNDGYTALYWAVKYGSREVVSLLLEYGADPQVMSTEIAAPKDLRFPEPISTETRNEIPELVIRQNKKPKRKRKTFSLNGKTWMYD